MVAVELPVGSNSLDGGAPSLMGMVTTFPSAVVAVKVSAVIP